MLSHISQLSLGVAWDKAKVEEDQDLSRLNQLEVPITNCVLSSPVSHKIGEAYQPAIVKYKWYILVRSKGLVNYLIPLVSNAAA